MTADAETLVVRMPDGTLIPDRRSDHRPYTVHPRTWQTWVVPSALGLGLFIAVSVPAELSQNILHQRAANAAKFTDLAAQADALQARLDEIQVLEGIVGATGATGPAGAPGATGQTGASGSDGTNSDGTTSTPTPTTNGAPVMPSPSSVPSTQAPRVSSSGVPTAPTQSPVPTALRSICVLGACVKPAGAM